MIISKDISCLSENDRYLYIDMRPHLDVVLKYAPWEDGLIIYRQTDSGWEIDNSDPNLSLLGPEHETDPDLPVNQFIRSIPEDIRVIVSRFDHLQTKLLQLLALSDAARDLVHDIPLLLWLVADYAQNNDIFIDDIKVLLKEKRVEILTRIIGVQCGEVDVKFLKKIKPTQFNHRQLHFIKHYLYSNRTREFRYWKEIPYDALVILKNHRDLTSCRFIQLLADGNYKAMAVIRPNRTAIINLINDTVCMGRNLGVVIPMTFINKCASLAELQALHNKWVRKFNAREIVIKRLIPFPEPPIPGTPNIAPIQNEGELLHEGRFMKHCVGGYARKIHAGQSYIYRVLQPERATLEIRGRDSSVHIGQFSLELNGKPSRETYLEVVLWIENFKKNLC
ncbi:MAG: hypothetical protein COX19_09650 [Desulfobacterales bacterium CG23_combo_of_CG06-09_8_20_14_all_51_8]|nr:MAG: hypothetical protein COX19_09650 [Desulfobacterales bacterium CG23_combo_of_CG06-09_8_20_14_all_51_8]